MSNYTETSYHNLLPLQRLTLVLVTAELVSPYWLIPAVPKIPFLNYWVDLTAVDFLTL